MSLKTRRMLCVAALASLAAGASSAASLKLIIANVPVSSFDAEGQPDGTDGEAVVKLRINTRTGAGGKWRLSAKGNTRNDSPSKLIFRNIPNTINIDGFADRDYTITRSLIKVAKGPNDHAKVRANGSGISTLL